MPQHRSRFVSVCWVLGIVGSVALLASTAIFACRQIDAGTATPASNFSFK